MRNGIHSGCKILGNGNVNGEGEMGGIVREVYGLMEGLVAVLFIGIFREYSLL